MGSQTEHEIAMRKLYDATKVDDDSEKDYYIRQALQLLTISQEDA